MRFILNDTEYSSDDIGDLTQRDMIAMAKQAKMGVRTWMQTLIQIDRLALAPDGEGVVVLSEAEAKADPDRCDPDLMLDSERHLTAWFVWVWLVRRMSGETTLTFDDSIAMPMPKLLPDAPEPVASEDEGVDPSLPSASETDVDGAPATS